MSVDYGRIFFMLGAASTLPGGQEDAKEAAVDLNAIIKAFEEKLRALEKLREENDSANMELTILRAAKN